MLLVASLFQANSIISIRVERSASLPVLQSTQVLLSLRLALLLQLVLASFAFTATLALPI
jgi:hypothetical protein